MRYAAVIITLAALAFAASGCGPSRPMTRSEFLGFCYQSPGDFFSGSANSIPECNAYTVVIGRNHASLGECLAGCAAVQADQIANCQATGCASRSADARDWCDKYCRSNYPK